MVSSGDTEGVNDSRSPALTQASGFSWGVQRNLPVQRGLSKVASTDALTAPTAGLQLDEEATEGQAFLAAAARPSARVLTFFAAVVTLLTEALPWLTPVSFDRSVAREDLSALTWGVNFPWASRETLFSSVPMSWTSALTVLAVAVDGFRCAKLVAVWCKLERSWHSAEVWVPLPAGAGADAVVGGADGLDEADDDADEPQAPTATATNAARTTAVQGLMALTRDIFPPRSGLALPARALGRNLTARENTREPDSSQFISCRD